MPWQETNVVDERLRFLIEYLHGEDSMSALCRKYRISRKTGYLLVHRYLLEGPRGLYDHSRAPLRHPDAIPADIVSAILNLRDIHRTWGARKLLAWLIQHRPHTQWPSASTIGRILSRHGRIEGHRRRAKTPPYTQPFAPCDGPNKIWCADFKGWFRTGDGKRCEPLTVTDGYSRFVLACRALPTTSFAFVQPVFESLFRRFGLPWVIRTDNGSPFASNALGGLSRLSVWWIKLGIVPERIEPGHPEQNGRHERFHRTLKADTLTPPQPTISLQQAVFERFCREFNDERPHEALAYKTPSARYHRSQRPLPTRLLEMRYPDHMIVRNVRPSGQVRWKGKEIFISETLAGETIAFEPGDDHIFTLHYGPIQLARFDEHKHKLIKPVVKWKKRC